MGANLALNFASRGIDVAAYDRKFDHACALAERADGLEGTITPCEDHDALIAALDPPRAVMMMVPSGEPVAEQTAAMVERMQAGDVIIDGGNSNFHDTMTRVDACDTGGVLFVGVGVSGGAEGARNGPSLMAGGTEDAWGVVGPLLRPIAARAPDGDPCAKWMGSRGAGHFVKSVHNGIEYADMQMISEAYALMRHGLGLEPEAMSKVFADWNMGELGSYLVEITAEILDTTDPDTGQPVVDVIEDVAAQKGTGRWTVIEGQRLGSPLTTIEAAVVARLMSARKAQRVEAEPLLHGPEPNDAGIEVSIEDIHDAMLAARIMTYTQGFAMITDASREYGMGVPLPEVARVWRAGCIIRSVLLPDMAAALEDDPGRLLLLAPDFLDRVNRHGGALRRVVTAGNRAGYPIPAMSAALAYLDSLRTARSPANLIQAQRDFFGRHGFKRVDRDGDHHGPWADGD